MVHIAWGGDWVIRQSDNKSIRKYISQVTRNLVIQGRVPLLRKDEGGSLDAGIIWVDLHGLKDFFGATGGFGEHGQAG